MVKTIAIDGTGARLLPGSFLPCAIRKSATSIIAPAGNKLTMEDGPRGPDGMDDNDQAILTPVIESLPV